MTACKFRADKDKASEQQKIVFMLSTCHQPAMESIPGKNAQNPKVIRDYNIHMEGVDCVDQQLHGFHTLRKSYKWYKKLAFKLMMQMTLNAHKVFQKSTESTMNFHSFIHEIIATLITLRPSEQEREPIPDDTFHHHLVDISYWSRKPHPKQKTNALQKDVEPVMPVEYILRIVLL